MHTNQVESPGLVCLGRGDGLKNGKKMRFARSGPFSQILSHISVKFTVLIEYESTKDGRPSDCIYPVNHSPPNLHPSCLPLGGVTSLQPDKSHNISFHLNLNTHEYLEKHQSIIRHSR